MRHIDLCIYKLVISYVKEVNWLKYILNVQTMTGRLQKTYRYGLMISTTSLSSTDHYLPRRDHTHTSVITKEKVKCCFVQEKRIYSDSQVA